MGPIGAADRELEQQAEFTGPSELHRAAPAETVYHHAVIEMRTVRGMQFIDITDRVKGILEESGVECGMVNIQTEHTTTGIMVNEHEPLLLQDLRVMLEGLAPAGRGYQHDRFDIRTVNMTPWERPNGHAHCRAVFLSPSALVNVADNRLMLGTWQRIFLVELDRPRRRRVSVMVTGRRGNGSDSSSTTPTNGNGAHAHLLPSSGRSQVALVPATKPRGGRKRRAV